MSLIIKGLAKLFDINLDEDQVQVQEMTLEDYKSDIYKSESHIKYEELEKKIESDIFQINDRTAPRCYRCSTINPEFVWHKRFYCLSCLIKKDVLLGELHPTVVPEQLEVGIIIMKNGSRLPILWDFDGDTIDKFERAKRAKKLFVVYDLEEGKVYLDPNDVQVLKKPVELFYEEWTDPAS